MNTSLNTQSSKSNQKNEIKISSSKQVLALAFFISSTAFAGPQLIAKSGSIELKAAPEIEAKVICQTLKHERLDLVKQSGLWSLIKAQCGQGWAENDQLAMVSKSENPNYTMDAFDILSGIDWEEMIVVMGQEVQKSDDRAEINRNFREYLVATEFRDHIEMKNGEF